MEKKMRVYDQNGDYTIQQIECKTYKVKELLLNGFIIEYSFKNYKEEEQLLLDNSNTTEKFTRYTALSDIQRPNDYTIIGFVPVVTYKYLQDFRNIVIKEFNTLSLEQKFNIIKNNLNLDCFKDLTYKTNLKNIQTGSWVIRGITKIGKHYMDYFAN